MIRLFSCFFYLLVFCSVTAQTNKTLHVEVSGKGAQSIVFIPGFASSGDVWNSTRKLFEKNYTCYTLTMPGFAGIPAEPDPSISRWEINIANYIKTNRINKPILIGHSMGGLLAMDIAADHRDLIYKIVIVDALPCLQALSNPSFKSKDSNDCSGIVKQFLTIKDDQFYSMQKMGVKQLLNDTTNQELVVKWSLLSDRKTFAQMYCDFSNTDLRQKISNIKCPSLILLEPYFKNVETTINKQFSNLKTAKIEFATKGLHFIMYDDKEWFEKELSEFIEAK